MSTLAPINLCLPCCGVVQSASSSPLVSEVEPPNSSCPRQRFLPRIVVFTSTAFVTAVDVFVGVVVEAVLYPIDTIKTRLQAAHLGSSQSLFKGLYSGLAGNLVGVLPASAVFVGVCEPVKRKLLSALPDQLTWLAHLVVKQRMQTGPFGSAQVALRQIVAKEGIRGLYAGFGSFLLRDIPFDAFQFCIYEQLKIGYGKQLERELNDPEAVFMGAIAGAITGAVTTPLDVIKTRLMIQGTSAQYKGIHNCVIKIIREEGAGTLFQGLGARILWIGLGGSIFFGALEKTKDLWRIGLCRRPLLRLVGMLEQDNSSEDTLTLIKIRSV